ncbi:putative carbohydrate-binding protein with CBM5 and CBM33 domain [Streptacidiphilus sp. MAP12-20]|uniref:lytic polysaccharide monooxygenase n=1 Tax=Streptacidiphilus sp. MAP12-20 TaxID=3156299 RepID=UPI003514F45F
MRSPFAYVSDPGLSDERPTNMAGVVSGSYEFTVKLPEKQGNHIIFTIWQRERAANGAGGSGETFHSVSDVTFAK